jgi:DNA-binding ferritin-like protein
MVVTVNEAIAKMQTMKSDFTQIIKGIDFVIATLESTEQDKNEKMTPELIEKIDKDLEKINNLLEEII